MRNKKKDLENIKMAEKQENCNLDKLNVTANNHDQQNSELESKSNTNTPNAYATDIEFTLFDEHKWYGNNNNNNNNNNNIELISINIAHYLNSKPQPTLYKIMHDNKVSLYVATQSCMFYFIFIVLLFYCFIVLLILSYNKTVKNNQKHFFCFFFYCVMYNMCYCMCYCFIVLCIICLSFLFLFLYVFR